MTRNISSYSLDEKRLNSTEPYSILLLRIEALRHTQPVLYEFRPKLLCLGLKPRFQSCLNELSDWTKESVMSAQESTLLQDRKLPKANK